MKNFHRAILVLIAMSPAIAVAQGQQVNIFSFEDASCNAWLKSGGNKLLRAQYEFWIRGFASGHNFANPSRQVTVGKFPGSDALYQYLDKYCHDNPDSSYIAGAIHLIEDLREAVAPAKAPPAKKESAKAAPAPVKPAAKLPPSKGEAPTPSGKETK